MRRKVPFKPKYKYEQPIEANAVIFVLRPCKIVTDKSLVLCANLSEILPLFLFLSLSLSLGELSTMTCHINFLKTKRNLLYIRNRSVPRI